MEGQWKVVVGKRQVAESEMAPAAKGRHLVEVTTAAAGKMVVEDEVVPRR